MDEEFLRLLAQPDANTNLLPQSRRATEGRGAMGPIKAVMEMLGGLNPAVGTGLAARDMHQANSALGKGLAALGLIPLGGAAIRSAGKGLRSMGPLSRVSADKAQVADDEVSELIRNVMSFEQDVNRRFGGLDRPMDSSELREVARASLEEALGEEITEHMRLADMLDSKELPYEQMLDVMDKLEEVNLRRDPLEEAIARLRNIEDRVNFGLPRHPDTRQPLPAFMEWLSKFDPATAVEMEQRGPDIWWP